MSGKMSADVLVSEVEWLLEGGVHPVWVARALGHNLNAIEKACQRAGRYDLARPFGSERKLYGRKVTA